MKGFHSSILEKTNGIKRNKQNLIVTHFPLFLRSKQN